MASNWERRHTPVAQTAGLLVLGASLAACNLAAHLRTPGPPTPTGASTSPLSPAATGAPLPTAITEEVEPTTAPPSSPTPTEEPGTTFSSAERSETRGAVTLVTVMNTTHYHINGGSADEIDRQMRTLGPTDPLGGYHWYALTEPLFDWRYPCPCNAGGCTTGPVTMYLTLDYTLPLWLAPDGAGETLRAQWAAFEAALTLHEHGHGERAAECSWRLGETFARLPPAPTCTDVDQAVLTASREIFAGCRDTQGQYETETDHGRTQGVSWPP
jgi:predicted secreted Zn-dependent protease